MKNLMKCAATLTVLFAVLMGGIFVGYRATMHQAQIYILPDDSVAVTAWGHTDLYYVEAYG